MAGRYQVGRVVAAAQRHGYDVIRTQLHLGRLRTAVPAGEVVAPEDLVPEALGDGHVPPPSRSSFPLLDVLVNLGPSLRPGHTMPHTTWHRNLMLGMAKSCMAYHHGAQWRLANSM